jgi:hypothetical protein
MKKVVLVSCVSKKLTKPAKAEELYISDLFKKNLAYAKSLKPRAIYILSAKHGLVPLAQVLTPYNQTLNTMGVARRRAWADKVLAQMRGKVDTSDEIVFLAGEKYRQYLAPHFKHARVPMKSLGIGKQLSFLKHALSK